jgi:hypothetical protein
MLVEIVKRIEGHILNIKYKHVNKKGDMLYCSCHEKMNI